MIMKVPKTEDILSNKIIDIIETNKKEILKTLNNQVVMTYWKIGKEIIIEEQNGKEKAEYGKKIINNISKVLTVKYGSGFSSSNLRRMRQFYTMFSDEKICATLSHQLTWSHNEPIALILCASKENEEIELLGLDKGNIRVSEYWLNLPPREILEEKLHKAIENATKKTYIENGDDNEI